MSGIESSGGFRANVPATGKLPTIRTQVTEKIHGKVDEKLKSAGVSEETRDALLADLTQAIEGQLASGGLPDPNAMRGSISDIFQKHGISLPDGMPPARGRMGLLSGYTGNGTADGPPFDAIQSLIANLQAASNESSDNKESPNDYASSFLNGLWGIDVEA